MLVRSIFFLCNLCQVWGLLLHFVKWIWKFSSSVFWDSTGTTLSLSDRISLWHHWPGAFLCFLPFWFLSDLCWHSLSPPGDSPQPPPTVSLRAYYPLSIFMCYYPYMWWFLNSVVLNVPWFWILCKWNHTVTYSSTFLLIFLSIVIHFHCFINTMYKYNTIYPF